MSSPADDEPVPRLPRGRGLKLDGAMMMRIGMTLLLLVMVVLTARPCANAASSFVTGFDEEGSAAPPQPGTVDLPAEPRKEYGDYEVIRPDMTEAEQRAAIERAKARAGAASPATTGSAGSAVPSTTTKPVGSRIQTE